MKLIIVDDEQLVLEDMEQILNSIMKGCEVAAFSQTREALAYLRLNSADIAFLDIEMAEMNGISLAKAMKDISPKLHIIFVTSYEKYAVDAFRIHATGYLMKPVEISDIKRELTFLYGDDYGRADARVRVQTFGGFDVFVKGRVLEFGRSKSKELLAYLIDSKGSGVTAGNACAALWEDFKGTKSQKSHYRNVVAELNRTLKEAGVGEILVKRRNYLAVRPELIDCDSYRFMEGDPHAVNQYRGSYMPCYSWAEYKIWDFEGWKI